ncbi:unnamed protein product [Parnassius apollo]|uniref:(apollo) hypothetical protein n=1 Tax=Parnassius apollo TaxID=110799 RepID=A0A8S3XM09_PARAO|nr:unnamed protein product [Parnassius apollo]
MMLQILVDLANSLSQIYAEECFRVWKPRFRCLLLGFTVSLKNEKLYTVALAILYNIGMKDEGIDYLEPVISEDNGDQQMLSRSS